MPLPALAGLRNRLLGYFYFTIEKFREVIWCTVDYYREQMVGRYEKSITGWRYVYITTHTHYTHTPSQRNITTRETIARTIFNFHHHHFHQQTRTREPNRRGTMSPTKTASVPPLCIICIVIKKYLTINQSINPYNVHKSRF